MSDCLCCERFKLNLQVVYGVLEPDSAPVPDPDPLPAAPAPAAVPVGDAVMAEAAAEPVTPAPSSVC